MGDDEVGTSGSGRGDAFDGLTLDESFVRGAAHTEGSHRDREKAANRQQKRNRKANRKGRTRRTLRRYAPLLLAAAIVVVAVGFGSRGQGPLGQVDPIRKLGGLAPADPTASGDGSDGNTTATDYSLSGVQGQPGTCMTWNQATERAPLAPESRDVDVVPCEDEHIFEAAATFQIDGTPYADTGPTDAEWYVIIDDQCRHRVEEYLGGELDDHGRYRATALTPTEKGWKVGDRRVLCGVGGSGSVTDAIPDGVDPPLWGKANVADQWELTPVGTCYEGSSVTDWGDVVDCAGPHTTEVVGSTDLSMLEGPYPGRDGIRGAADGLCRGVAESVYGAPLPREVGVSWSVIAEVSWDLGFRQVECLMGLQDDTGWISVTGPLRAPAP